MTTDVYNRVPRQIVMDERPTVRRVSKRDSLWKPWVVVLIGITTLGRTFAYLGVPPLFIGEMYFASAVYSNRNRWLGRFIDNAMKLEPLEASILAMLLWGVIEIFRSLFIPRPVIEVLKTAAFNYYPLYCLIGLSIGRDLTKERFIGFWKALMAFYALFAIISPFTRNSSNDALANMWPMMTSLVPVGTMALWKSLSRWRWRMVTFVLSLFPLFFSGAHGRGTLLGFIIGGCVIATATWARLVRSVIFVSMVLTVLMFVGPLIPGPEDSAPPLDPLVEVARLIAASNQDLAIKIIRLRSGRAYQAEVDNLISAKGTAYWRQVMWTNAMNSLRTTDLKLMGQGEGTSMAGLTSDNSPEDLRSPHNIMIYCIYYTGYVGLATFVAYLAALFFRGQRLFDPELRIFVLATIWGVILVSVTGNCLETPQGALPFYMLCGLAFGVDLSMRKHASAAWVPHQSQPQPRGRAALVRA